MTELAQEMDDVCLLSGDIGNRMFDRYKEVAPKRFINCGIAEANMMSMAAGMGLSGLRPVVYTITPFTTTRCLEQIRTGVAYHEAPVVIVGTGSGLSYAELGVTHHSLEDIAILRSIPNIRICAPTDSLELTAQLRQAIYERKPTYIRIGKKGEPNLLDNTMKLGIGKAHLLKPGKEFLLLGIGPIVNEALIAREKLKHEGVIMGVASMGSIKPLDVEFLKRCISEGYTKWITLEEHNKIGGLGSSLIEWLSHKEIDKVKLKQVGIDDHFIHQLGNQEYAREAEGLNWKGIKLNAEQKWN
ncbi:transketolase C-terminal domain-containing protein [Synechococcus sp. A15-24]|uniref:transketolase family protein n=1 Tax=Synechococcus sp. A15-24 TaxID=1050635 RepID=UPI00257049CC|nr:transketolase C-terminal domain-containing protein [Synechococcus sp. A15-24]